MPFCRGDERDFLGVVEIMLYDTSRTLPLTVMSCSTANRGAYPRCREGEDS